MSTGARFQAVLSTSSGRKLVFLPSEANPVFKNFEKSDFSPTFFQKLAHIKNQFCLDGICCKNVLYNLKSIFYVSSSPGFFLQKYSKTQCWNFKIKVKFLAKLKDFSQKTQKLSCLFSANDVIRPDFGQKLEGFVQNFNSAAFWGTACAAWVYKKPQK